MFGWLKKLWSSGASPGRGSGASERVKARFDAAATTGDNRRHWVNADNLAADAAASPEIRSILRSRGRYEQFNNPYVDGGLQTLAADQVGKTPALQMLTGDVGVDSIVETEFKKYAEEINLGEQLRVSVETEAAAGEMFIKLGFNPKINHPVKLGLTLFEGDQCATPDLYGFLRDDRRIDGIEFDRWNNPTFYHILKAHPGDTSFLGSNPLDYDRVPAADIIHVFRPRRPGQRRGIPRITSSLSLFADRRGFRVSVLSAARKAAELGAVLLQSEYPPDPDPDNPPEEGRAWDELDLTSGMMTVLPNGVKAAQMEPVQPSTSYKEFDDKLIGETLRPISMPFNIATCNSSGYNYSSGQLDHQTYDGANEIDRFSILELKILRRIFMRWRDEALRIPGYLPARAVRKLAGVPPIAWLWRTRKNSNPIDNAKAAQIRMETYQTSLGEELAADGKDFESHITRLARERAAMLAAGLTPLEPQKPAAAGTAPGDTPPADEPPADDLNADRKARNGNGVHV